MAKLRMLITATAEQVKEPFLWRLGKDYNVVVNVKRANFTEDGGYAYVELDGSVEEIQRATALEIPFIVMHPGAHMGAGEPQQRIEGDGAAGGEARGGNRASHERTDRDAAEGDSEGRRAG